MKATPAKRKILKKQLNKISNNTISNKDV